MVEHTPKRKTASNSPSSYSGGITIKSRREMEAMERAGAIVGATLTLLKNSVEPGMTTGDLNRIADKNIRSMGAVPTFIGYHGFPAAICASVNEEIVHGIPGKRVLKEGDIIKMDVGATIDGFIGDAAISVAVGEVTGDTQKLMDDTEASLYAGIAAAQPGNRIGDIGAAVSGYAVPRGYGVVRQFVGHGVGRYLHEDPQVPNYGEAGKGVLLRPGMCICIEPMLNMGTENTTILGDDWTVVTADGALSAHFEHTLAITADGPKILTMHD
ncbi:Methionine aminopeptidase [Geodia barretti]|uniref:Methionine aminopeptidase n=1 Tax=Geodia barretti TaxID=519541 RepID=A0AA35RKB7_GEOBA|nr:Methionine aminopeptidase [Geodia barretti]